MTRGRRRGFTLVEVLIVVVIIAILATIVQPRVLGAIISAREAVLKQDLYVMRDAIDQYYADKGVYPPSLMELVEERYLRRIPVDPMTGSRESWVVVFDRQSEEAGMPHGVFDVRSASEAVAQDGSRYSEW